MKPNGNYDVVIAGGGPAAVSAAILLGRRMRKVLFCDASDSELDSFHNPDRLLGGNVCCPSEFLRTGRIHLNRLDTVTCVRQSVCDVRRDETGFLITADNGKSWVSKSILLASDFVARFPSIPGVERFYGASLHQCPYCDGWEHRGRIVGVIGNDDGAVGMALKLLIWFPRVTLYTHAGKLSNAAELRLRGKPVEVVTGSIRSLEGPGHHLESVRMENGSNHACQALFFPARVRSHFHLAGRVGSDMPRFLCGSHPFPDWGSGIQGLFFTCEPEDGVEMAVSAAADGVKAGEAVNQWLMEADRSYLASHRPQQEPSWNRNLNVI